MEKVIDEIGCISSLVQQLAKQVAESHDHIAKVHKVTTSLNEEYNETNEQLPTTANNDSDEERALIQKLESDRLSLVMDLQRQDYVGEKLLEIINQNQDTVETVKEYLSTKSQIRHEEAVYANKKFANYKNHVLQPTIDQLDSMLFDLFTDMHKVQVLIESIKKNTEENLSTLASDQYQEKLNEFVARLNEIYDGLSVS